MTDETTTPEPDAESPQAKADAGPAGPLAGGRGSARPPSAPGADRTAGRPSVIRVGPVRPRRRGGPRLRHRRRRRARGRLVPRSNPGRGAAVLRPQVRRARRLRGPARAAARPAGRHGQGDRRRARHPAGASRGAPTSSATLPRSTPRSPRSRPALAAKREAEAAARAQASEAARVERERIVAEAERIAAQPPASTQWKTSGEQMRTLLDEWKAHQRRGPKLDKTTETDLWHRFSHARNVFDKARRSWFAQLESTRSDARATKETLVAEAEAALDEQGLGTDRPGLQGAHGPVAARRPRRTLRRRRPVGAVQGRPGRVLRRQGRGRRRRGRVVPGQPRGQGGASSSRPSSSCRSPTSRPPRPPCGSSRTSGTGPGKVPRGRHRPDREGAAPGRGRRPRRGRAALAGTNPEVVARAQSMVTQLEASVASLSTTWRRPRRRGTRAGPRTCATVCRPSSSGSTRPGPGSTSSPTRATAPARAGGHGRR